MLKYQVKTASKNYSRAFSPAPSSSSSSVSYLSTFSTSSIDSTGQITVLNCNDNDSGFATDIIMEEKDLFYLNLNHNFDNSLHRTVISISEENKEDTIETNNKTCNFNNFTIDTKNFNCTIPKKSLTNSPQLARHNLFTKECQSLAASPLLERKENSLTKFDAERLNTKDNKLTINLSKKNYGASLLQNNKANTTKLKKKQFFCSQFPKELYNRSNSLNSLSSMDSGESLADLGYLRIFTGGIRSDTDYVTLKISNQTTCHTVIERILYKFRLSHRDLNLFQLWMEVRTKMYNGSEVKSILELEKDAKPLELQKCHPKNMSRFILSMISNGIVAKIFDNNISPQSNYKSVLISKKTTCFDVLRLILQMTHIIPTKKTIFLKKNNEKTISGDKEITKYLHNYGLYIEENVDINKLNALTMIEIPYNCLLAGVYLSLTPNQRIVLKKK